MQLKEIGYANWKGWQASAFGLVDRVSAAYFRAELRRSGVNSVSGSDVLEIGFGNGVFAGWVAENGGNYLGIELLEELVQRGQRAGFNTKSAGLPRNEVAPDSTIDLAVAFDVMEHVGLEDIRRLLRDVDRWLRPGGILIGRMPSGDSPFARAVQHGDLTHRTVLGSSALRQLAEEAGFSVREIREPAFPLIGAGAMSFMRRLAALVVRRTAFALIRSAIMGDRNVVLAPNMVFVLVKP